MAKTKAKDWKKQILEKYGDVIVSGTNVLNNKKDAKVLSVSPMLDISLGGGIKEGSWVMLSGDPKCGKTTTAMQIAANAQKEGRHVLYVDAEGRLKEMNFEVPELDPEKMSVMQPRGKPIPAEKFLDWAYNEMTNPDNHGAVLIIDSIVSSSPGYTSITTESWTVLIIKLFTFLSFIKDQTFIQAMGTISAVAKP